MSINKKMRGYGLQAMIFRKNPRYANDPTWTTRDAELYMNMHDIHPIKPVHETVNFYRYRITDPKSYKKIYSIDHNNGILSIVGTV
jgi:hypothetical protein